MKIGVIPENLVERVLLSLGQVPTPYMETQLSIILARAIMAATQLGVFEAVASTALTLPEIAAQCSTDKTALQKLLSALVSAGYLKRHGERYALAPVARKLLLRENQHSLHDLLIFIQKMDWEWLTQLEDHIRTGEPVHIHKNMSPNQWEVYQRGMQALATICAPEVGRRTPVPRGARNMLDIGGSHGYFSVAICRQHPGLNAIILDLPEAVEHAEPMLVKAGMGDRVVHRVGDALTDDLGTDAYDLVFIANLVHHFDETTNLELFRRVAKSLRSGGYLVIQENLIIPNKTGQLGMLLDLYFGLLSDAGNWSFKDIVNWQREAGLMPLKLIPFVTAPGTGQQVAVKHEIARDRR